MAQIGEALELIRVTLRPAERAPTRPALPARLVLGSEQGSTPPGSQGRIREGVVQTTPNGER
jgi:hypothetical protein